MNRLRPLGSDIYDDIGRNAKLNLWVDRIQSLNYEIPGYRIGEGLDMSDFYENKVIRRPGKDSLLVFLPKGLYGAESIYTVNLRTMEPTCNSHNKTKLTHELKNRLIKMNEVLSAKPIANYWSTVSFG
jgi:hypothetical protein